MVAGLGLGFAFLFLPTLPLFYHLLNRTPGNASAAIVTASIIITLVAGSAVGLMFFLFLGVPTHYFASSSLRFRPRDATLEWQPIGPLLTRLTVYGTCALACVTMYYYAQGISLPHLLTGLLRAAFANAGDEYGEVIGMISGELFTFALPFTLWLWVILLFANAWMAQRLLAHNRKQLRPNMAITPFTLPAWLLTLLAICAFASLAGSEALSFLGKTSLLTLMLPYFFLGLSLLHQAVKAMSNKKIILFFTYLALLLQLWPVFVFVGIGFWHQVKGLHGSSSDTTKK